MKHFILSAATGAALSVLPTLQSYALSIGGCIGRICTDGTVIAQGSNCATSSRTCYGTQAVISCNTCSSGTRTARTVSVTQCEDPVTYYTCTGSGGRIGTTCSAGACGVNANIVMRGTNCASYASETCLYSPSGNQGVQSCATCPSGYKKSTQNVTITGCSNTLSFTTCVSTCNGTCTNCTDTNWTASNVGYQSRVNATCNTSTCVCTKKTEYRCADNYYGTPTGNLSGCTACPNNGMSAAGLNSAVTSCYITGGSDASGTYVFDQGRPSFFNNDKCYYSN